MPKLPPRGSLSEKSPGMDNSDNSTHRLSTYHLPGPVRSTKLTLPHCMSTPTLSLFLCVHTEKNTEAQEGEILCLRSHGHSKGRTQSYILLAVQKYDMVQLKWYSCDGMNWMFRDQKVSLNCHQASPVSFGVSSFDPAIIPLWRKGILFLPPPHQLVWRAVPWCL